MSNINILAGVGSIPASSNQTWYVATTGSDSNPGTSAKPFATIQHALNIAAQYNYQAQYTATINVADGTYSSIVVPELYNYPYIPPSTYPYDNSSGFPKLVGDAATPANCIIQTSTTDAVACQPLAQWSLNGFRVKSTSGVNFDIFAQYGAALGINNIDFAGSGRLLGASNYSAIFCINASLTVSTASAFNLFYAVANSYIINDGSTTTFTNTPNFTNYVCWEENWGFVGNGTFVNGSTVTGNRFSVTTFSYLEFSGARSTFPGNGTCVLAQGGTFAGDTNSVLGAFADSSPTLANAIFLSDGVGNIGADYNYTTSGYWAFHANTGYELIANGSNALDFNLTNPGNWTFHNTWGIQSAVKTQGFFANSSDLTEVPWVGFSDATYINSSHFTIGGYISGNATFDFNISNGVLRTLENGAYCWVPSTTDVGSSNPDTGLSRTGAASLAIGNGTVGDFSGSLELTDLYTNDATFLIRCKTSLTNGAGSSAGTLTNAPAIGNPTKWIGIDDNGTTRYIPTWT